MRSTRRCRPRDLDDAVDATGRARSRSGPTVTLGLTKWLLHAGRDASLDQHLRNEAFALELSSRTDDFREGMAAFRERRAPRLRGTLSERHVTATDTPLAIESGADERGRGRGGARVDRGQRAARVDRRGPRRWRGRGARGAHACRVRGVVSGVRGARVSSCRRGRSRTAGSICRPRSRAGSSRSCAPFNLGRLNPLGLNLAAPALFAHGTEEQRLRFLPPIVRNEEVWCQLFSEPGAGSDLASLATRAVRDGDRWIVTGQKVWTTWAHLADFGVLLARTDVGRAASATASPTSCSTCTNPVSRSGRCATSAARSTSTRCSSTEAVVPDAQRVGAVGDGWKVANATLSGERQMVSGAGSGGVDRIGGLGVDHLLELARRSGRGGDPVVRQELMRVLSEERIRGWTNQRVRAQVKAGRSPGPESSIGKVHQGGLNQRVQLLATALLGMDAIAWTGDARAARGARDAAQPREHDRRRHDRDQQERGRRAGARPAARARPVARRVVARDTH